MTFQEKRLFAAIVSTVLVFGIYYWVIYGMHATGQLEGPEGLILLGQSVLVTIVCAIVVNIALTILFNIFFAIRDREENPSFIVDERDRLIEGRGVRFNSYVTGGGFVAAMAVLALGGPMVLAINLIVLGYALGDLTSNLLMISIYRKDA